MSDIIQQRSISFDTIKADLLAYIQSKPDYLRWKDFLDSSAGTIVVDLIAGLGAFDAYNELARRLESYLDFARLQSSVYELAFNRGFMVPPAEAPEMTLTVTTISNETVNTGDIVGTISDYDVYSLESKTILIGVPTTIKCVVGRLNLPEDRTIQLTTYTAFSTIVVNLTEKNLAGQLERLMAGSTVLTLVDDIVNVGGTTYVLRRASPNQVKIYLGNGVLGWFDSGVTSLDYRRLTFDDDIQGKLSNTVILTGVLTSATLNSQTIDSRGASLLDTEQARGIARFYPLDGRAVTDRDYENVILKYYGAFVYDVYAFNDYNDLSAVDTGTADAGGDDFIYESSKSWTVDAWAGKIVSIISGMGVGQTRVISSNSSNQLVVSVNWVTNPDSTSKYVIADSIHKEHVYLLENTDFTPTILLEITNLIDLRRELGILVEYHEVSVSSGLVISCSFQAPDLTDELRTAAEAYLNSRINKFMRESTFISTINLAVELSAEFGIDFYPGDGTVTPIAGNQFIKQFIITWL